MMRILLTVILIAMFVLAACAAKQEIVCPDGTVVATADECPKVTETDDEPADVTPPAPSAPVVVEQPLSGEIKTLLDGVSKVKSVSFLHAPVKMGTDGPIPRPADRYWRSGDKVKVELPVPDSLPSGFSDVVYLDLAKRSGVGFCTSRISKCGDEGLRRPVNFGDYEIMWPQEWTEDVAGNAFVKGSLQWENRQVKVIRYERGGDYYEMYVDQFYGLPIRVAIFENSDYTKQKVGGVEYRDIAINAVKESDVTEPQ